jgi:dethiobiotin synthetase
MTAYFITGTDTEIGKTFVTCALMVALRNRGIRVAPMKPVAAGMVQVDGRALNEDVQALMAVYGAPISAPLINPYCLHDAIAPHIAAKREGVTVSMLVIQNAFADLAVTHDAVLVEGAGGFLVPLDDRRSMAEIPVALGLDVVLVVGLRLGCINHALLTANAIRACGLRLAAWVGNVVDAHMPAQEENIATLRAMLHAPCLGIVPRLANGSAIERATAAAGYLSAEPLLIAEVNPAAST